MSKHQPNARRVSSADLVRNPALWQERALDGPLIITYHGRDRLVLRPIEHEAPNKPLRVGLEDRLVKAHMAELYAVFDRDRYVVEVNRHTCEFFGRSEDELIGIHISSVRPDLDWSPLIARLQRVLDTGETDHFEAESFIHPGRHLAYTIYAHPRGAAVLALNVTEKHMLAHQVAVLMALSLGAQQIQAVCGMRLDRSGRVVICYGAFHDWTGFADEDVLHHHVSAIIAVPHQTAVSEGVASALEAHKITKLDVEFASPTRENIPVHLAIAPVIDGFDAKGAVIVAIRN